MELSANSNTPGRTSDEINLAESSFTREPGTKKPIEKVIFERKISLPERNGSYEGYRRNILEHVLKKTVDDTMREIGGVLSKSSDLGADFMVRLTVNEIVSNAIFYGFLGLTTEEKEIFITRGALSEQKEDQTLREKIMESENGFHHGVLKVEASRKEVKITIQDPGKFPGFVRKWNEAKAKAEADDDASDGDVNGRGLLLIAAFYDDAEQDRRTGAITFSKYFGSAKAA